MWRALLLTLAFLTVAVFEFAVWPGHSYLQSGSQLYLSVLEHISAPGYLSRDFLASHFNLSYTAYDEITLFLHRAARLSFEDALLGQLFLSRLAALMGALLLARAAGLGLWLSLVASTFISLGTFLPGLALSSVELEPVPRAFALGFALLAMGLLARLKPLLSALSAGIAFLYDPFLALPFWLLVIAACLFDRKLRKLLRPMLPVLLVFALLLANLAQLQPDAPDTAQFFGRLSTYLTSIEKFRVPAAFPSLWPHGALYFYVATLVAGVAALRRIWPALNRPSRWIFIAVPLLGITCLPLSAWLIDVEHAIFALRLQPARLVLYLVSLAWLASTIAALRAWQHQQRREALIWLIAALCLLSLNLRHPEHRAERAPAVNALAAWARNTTWGGSVFLFPDAGRARYPGIFRAQSRRSLWIDWLSGAAIVSNPELAGDWFARWQSTMQAPLTGPHLRSLLRFPIDYYVLDQRHRVVAHRPVAPAFEDRCFVVYEAESLRFVPGDLEIVTRPDAPCPN